MNVYAIFWGIMAVLCIVGLTLAYVNLFRQLFDSNRNVVEFLVDEYGNFIGASINSTIRPGEKTKKCRVKIRVLSDEEVNDGVIHEDM